MKNIYKLSLTAAVASLILVGCGAGESIGDLVAGDIDDERFPVTGQFVDTYVEGLKFSCTKVDKEEGTTITSTGVTNAKGEYTCDANSNVEFSLGTYVIGSGQSGGFDGEIISPIDIAIGDVAIYDIAQLLQTIDSDFSDGAINIPADFNALENIDVKPGDAGFDDLMADALGVTVLISEKEAADHLNASIRAAYEGTEPVDILALVSGKIASILTYDGESLTLTFEGNGDYTEDRAADGSCVGTWEVVNVNDKDYIAVTCDGETTSGIAYDFNEIGSVTIISGDINSGDSFTESVTFTNI